MYNPNGTATNDVLLEMYHNKASATQQQMVQGSNVHSATFVSSQYKPSQEGQKRQEGGTFGPLIARELEERSGRAGSGKLDMESEERRKAL